MKDVDERVEPLGDDAGANTKARPTATPDTEPAGSHPPPRHDSGKQARAGRPFAPETTRLVCAASVAVALGVACGLWLNARLASAASALPVVQNRLLPEAPAGVRAADASPPLERAPDEHREDPHAPPAPVEAASSHGPEDFADAGVPGAEPAGAVDKDGRESRGVSRTADPPAAKAYETAGPGKLAVKAGDASVVKSRAGATGARGVEAPCAFYTSAGALNIRGGAAAPVVVGGPGRHGRVTVSTPNWSDIVVLPEGPAGGGKGWLKYSVRSVSNRAGVYAVHVSTPCGSQTIPVTVVR
jgi:hypothetical protein